MPKEVTSADGEEVIVTSPVEDLFLPIPDDENPAILDARKTYIYTVAGAAAFIAVVILFVLM